jgi:hypothetical protein
MSYGADLIHIWRRCAYFVDKILNGAKHGDIPIEQPTKFELVINLKIAKGLGLTIPPSLLLRADQIIEESFLKTRGSRMSACLRTDPLLVGHGQMAWDRSWDTAVSGSHAPGVSTGEPCASAATRRAQGAPAAAAADGDRSDLLGSAVAAVDELAAFVAGGPAADRGWLAPAGISTLFGRGRVGDDPVGPRSVRTSDT